MRGPADPIGVMIAALFAPFPAIAVAVGIGTGDSFAVAVGAALLVCLSAVCAYHWATP